MLEFAKGYLLWPTNNSEWELMSRWEALSGEVKAAVASAAIAVIATVISIAAAVSSNHYASEANRIAADAVSLGRSSDIETRSNWYLAYDRAKYILTETDDALLYLVEHQPEPEALSNASDVFPGPRAIIDYVRGSLSDDLELAERLVPIETFVAHDHDGLVYSSPDIFSAFRALKPPAGALLRMMREGGDIYASPVDAGFSDLADGATFVGALRREVAELLMAVTEQTDALENQLQDLHGKDVVVALQVALAEEEAERLAMTQSAVAIWYGSHGAEVESDVGAILSIARSSGWSLAYLPARIASNDPNQPIAAGDLVWLGRGSYPELAAKGLPAVVDEAGILLQSGSDEEWKRYIQMNSFEAMAADWVQDQRFDQQFDSSVDMFMDGTTRIQPVPGTSEVQDSPDDMLDPETMVGPVDAEAPN